MRRGILRPRNAHGVEEARIIFVIGKRAAVK
jgi:hypothetical protein